MSDCVSLALRMGGQPSLIRNIWEIVVEIVGAPDVLDTHQAGLEMS